MPTPVIMSDTQKWCPQCAQTLPLTAFNRCRGRRLGVAGWCKQCQGRSTAHWQGTRDGRLKKRLNQRKRRDGSERFRSRERNYRRQYYARNRQQSLAGTREERRRAPDKHLARRTAYYALRQGELTKPNNCQRCGRPATGRYLQMHHADYGKPLDVTWLCSRCHGLEHRI